MVIAQNMKRPEIFKKLISSGAHTLIETLVSMMLIAMVTVGGMVYYLGANELQGMALHKKIATELANTRMEELRATNYAVLTAGTTSSDIIVGGLEAKVSDGRGMQVTISEIDEDSPPNGTDYKKIQVQVRWEETDEGGKDFDIELASYVAP